MAVGTDTVAVRYENVSAGTPISVPYPVYETTDVYVYYGLASLLAVRGVDYTLTLEDDFDTFTLTPTASLVNKIDALIAADPAEENYITVRRTLDYLTESTPPNVRYTPFTSREFDRTALRFQQIDEKLNRAITLAPNYVGDQPLIVLGPALPGRALMFNDDATQVVPGPTSDEIQSAQSYAEIAQDSAEIATSAAASLAGRVSQVGSIAALAALDVNTNTAVVLVHPTRGGLFELQASNLWTAAIASDTQNGVFVPSTVDATKVWVRQAFSEITLEWFGAGPSVSAAVNSNAIDAAFAVAVATGVKIVRRRGSGVYQIARSIVMTHGVRFFGTGNNAENGAPYYGPSAFAKAFSGGYALRLLDSCVAGGFDIIRSGAHTGGGVEWAGARARAEDISCFNLVGKGFSIELTAPNMNLWSSIRCRAVDCTGDGFVVAQFRPAANYANGIVLALNAEYYNASNGRNYRVTAAGAGNTTASGTMAADLAANPTWWTLSSFQFGAPDTNGGWLQEFEASRCSGKGLVLQNTHDNVCHVVIQNCGQGIDFDYGSSGNRITGYAEANTSSDVYFGATAVGNEARLSALVPPVVVDNSDVDSRSKNIVWRKIDDTTGNAGYMPTKLEAWSPEAVTSMDLFSGPNFIKAASLQATNPSGSVGRLEIYVKPSGAAPRRMASLYSEGRADWFGSAANNTFHAFYDSSNVQRGSISNTGATTTYATSSDQNWKDDQGVLSEDEAMRIVDRLIIHKFKWKAEHGGADDAGLFAQELHMVYPQAVVVGGANARGEYVPWQVDYSKLVVPLLRAFQAQRIFVNSLAARINVLEGKG